MILSVPAKRWKVVRLSWQKAAALRSRMSEGPDGDPGGIYPDPSKIDETGESPAMRSRCCHGRSSTLPGVGR
jgi:hypothetical protein